MRALSLAVGLACILIGSGAFARHLRAYRSPFSFRLVAREDTTVKLGLLAEDKLEAVRLNRILVSKEMPTESVLVVKPDGKAVFFYSDLFLRHFRGREQVSNAKDVWGRAKEDLLRFPRSATPPKFLRDIWRINATHLYMNHREDILWWTGELVYRFEFAFPVRWLKLESPEGRKTVVGDWEWEKVGRAVKIYASTDGKNWVLIWRSHGNGGKTLVEAEIPPEMRGTKIIYLKFWGQNANVLFNLFVTAELDAREALPLLRLRRGENCFVFEDAPDSSHKAIVFWEGKGIRAIVKRPRIAYPEEEPKVVVQQNEIVVLFPERVGVWLEADGGIVRGIKRLTVGQREVLGQLRVKAPTASVIVGGKVEPVEDWAAYLEERDRKRRAKKITRHQFPEREGQGLKIEQMPVEGKLINWGMEGEWVCVTLNLTKGVAHWLFSPAEERLGGGAYRGLRWKLRLEGVGRVYEVTVEEPVAFTFGDWRLQQVWGPFEEHRLGVMGEFYMPERGYFARQQPFFFLAGEEGAKVGFFGKVVHAVVSERSEIDRLVLRSKIPVRAGKVVETPDKFWLFREGNFSSRWDALNEWTWVYDSLAQRYREMKEIKPLEPKPTLLWQAGWSPNIWGRNYFAAAKAGLPRTERWFYRLAKEMPKLAKWGVRAVYISGALESDADHKREEWLAGSFCFGSTCAPWRLEVSPCMGGEEGLRHLCQEAHRYGVRILLWSTPAHLSNSSPLLRQHPEWLAWRNDGRPEHFGYSDITGVSLRKGYFEYAVGQLEKIRKTTGYDGFWWDSFLTFGILTDFSVSSPYPQLDETLEMMKRLQAAGCGEMHIEGCGPFGLSSGGHANGRRRDIFERVKGREYGLYYFVADLIKAHELEPGSYFRALAGKGILGITSIQDFERLRAEAREKIVRLNDAFLKVLPFMKRRKLLGEGEKWLGVEWLDESGKPRILFSFEPMEWRVSKEARVVELTEGKRFVADNGTVNAEKWRIYFIEFDVGRQRHSPLKR